MRKVLLVVVIDLCLSTIVQAKNLQGIVTYVSDGDTFWLATNEQTKPIKVRMQGIDAPESCQAWGLEAKVALQTKLLKKQVEINTRAKDDYDRALARVSLGGQDVGQWMVSNGHAWSYHYRRDPGPYALEQAQAKSKRLGLWADTQPREPREFRKTNGACRH